MTKTITPYEVGQLLSEAQEKINLILTPTDNLTPADHQQIDEWLDDVRNIFSTLEDEASWVIQGKPMISNTLSR